MISPDDDRKIRAVCDLPAEARWLAVQRLLDVERQRVAAHWRRLEGTPRGDRLEHHGRALKRARNDLEAARQALGLVLGDVHRAVEEP